MAKNLGLIVTAKFSAPSGYHPCPGGPHFRQVLHVLTLRRRDAELGRVSLGLAPQRLSSPGAMAATTTVTGYDSTTLQIVTMETTFSDQAMPPENQYLADMVKLWERKLSQAASAPKRNSSRAVAQQKAATSSSSSRPSTDGACTTAPASLMRQVKWRPRHTPRLSRDDYIVVLKPGAPFELKSILSSDRVGDAIRAYLGEHSSSTLHV